MITHEDESDHRDTWAASVSHQGWLSHVVRWCLTDGVRQGPPEDASWLHLAMRVMVGDPDAWAAFVQREEVFWWCNDRRSGTRSYRGPVFLADCLRLSNVHPRALGLPAVVGFPGPRKASETTRAMSREDEALMLYVEVLDWIRRPGLRDPHAGVPYLPLAEYVADMEARVATASAALPRSESGR